MDRFFEQVYEIVKLIPVGMVATYGQIAVLLGKPRSARVVGWAMQSAPAELHLPCHRVVNRLGEMSPEHVFGGKDIQRHMLKIEGISFKKDGCIDMKKHLWKPTYIKKRG